MSSLIRSRLCELEGRLRGLPEGSRDGIHSAFYDLFRVDDGKLVEHWDMVEAIALASEWKNDNGKF